MSLTADPVHNGARGAEAEDKSLSNIMQMVAVMEKALREIDDYSAGSTVQPVQIARAALRKLYGPNFRTTVETPHDKT